MPLNGLIAGSAMPNLGAKASSAAWRSRYSGEKAYQEDSSAIVSSNGANSFGAACGQGLSG